MLYMFRNTSTTLSMWYVCVCVFLERVIVETHTVRLLVLLLEDLLKYLFSAQVTQYWFTG